MFEVETGWSEGPVFWLVRNWDFAVGWCMEPLVVFGVTFIALFVVLIITVPWTPDNVFTLYLTALVTALSTAVIYQHIMDESS
jgi:hypothetical protein